MLENEQDVRIWKHDVVVNDRDSRFRFWQQVQFSWAKLDRDQKVTEICFRNGMPAVDIAYETVDPMEGRPPIHPNMPMWLTNVLSFRFIAPVVMPGPDFDYTIEFKSCPEYKDILLSLSSQNESPGGPADALVICGYHGDPDVNQRLFYDERSVKIPSTYSVKSHFDVLKTKCELLGEKVRRELAEKVERKVKEKAMKKIEVCSLLDEVVKKGGGMSVKHGKILDGASSSLFTETGERDKRYFEEGTSGDRCLSDYDDGDYDEGDEDYKGKCKAVVKKTTPSVHIDAQERAHQRRLLAESWMEDSDDADGMEGEG